MHEEYKTCQNSVHVHVDNSNFNSGVLKYGTLKCNKNNKELDDDDDDNDNDYVGDKNNDNIQQQHSNIQR